MEDTSLSLLLEDLMQQNQIQWVESIDNKNDLYITNNNITTPDLFDMLSSEISNQVSDEINSSGFTGSLDEFLSATPTSDIVNTQNNKKRFVSVHAEVPDRK